MAIIQTVGFHAFNLAFVNSNRSNNFSSVGLELLFSMLTEYSDSINENLELDILGFCCEYSESSIEDFIEDYPEVTQNFNETKTLFILEYLRNYIFYNLEEIIKDSNLVSNYFNMLNNKEYLVKNVSDRMDLALDLTDYLVDSMNYEEFLSNICKINTDKYYIASIKNISYNTCINYLNNKGIFYKVSDCRNILVYQNF